MTSLSTPPWDWGFEVSSILSLSEILACHLPIEPDRYACKGAANIQSIPHYPVRIG